MSNDNQPNNTSTTFEENLKKAREANRKAVMLAWNVATMPYRMSAR